MDTAFLSARIPGNKKAELKAIAARKGTTVQTLVNDMVDGFIRRERVPELGKVRSELRRHAGYLKGRGIRHLAIYGSVARGDANPGSDVDLVVEFEAGTRPSLVTLGSIAEYLEQHLGVGVDLAERGMLRLEVAEEARQDEVAVF